MAHFLSTNWTEKIKTNPVANMILNSHRPKLYRVKLHQLTHNPAEGDYITSGFINKFTDKDVRDEIITAKQFKRTRRAYSTIPEYIRSYNSVVAADDDSDDDDVAVAAVRGGAGVGDKGQVFDGPAKDEKGIMGVEVKRKPDLDKAREIDEDDYDDENLLLSYEELQGGDMWANTYVNDYINIHHPRIRIDYVTALTGKPLQIKPPSVFFSDV